MNKKVKICCIIGNRPEKFPWDYYDESLESQKEYRSTLKITLEEYIKNGYTHFISGGARGVDMDFAELVLYFREIYPNIKLEMAIPYLKQNSAYNDKENQRYKTILSKADEISILNKDYKKGCLHKRNRYMIDKSDLITAFWNVEHKGGTYYSINYAEKANKDLEIICLQSFM